MKNLPRLVRALHEPLAIEPKTGRALVDLFGRKFVLDEDFSGEEIHAELGIQKGKGKGRPPRVGVIPIRGVIDRRAFSLGTGVDVIESSFDRLMADRSVDAILFDIDSPGGAVDGVPELADRIFQARGQKPMMALADTMMASAAYWIGSAADEVAVTPSGETGSIGVWSAHEDWSRWLQNEGIDITAFSAGKFKTEGAPWEPLDEEGREFWQARVDEVYGWFVRAVANHRRDTQKNVRAGYGEGRVLSAKPSVRSNLADHVMTFDQAVERLSSRVERKGKNADTLRRKMVLDSLEART